MAALTGICDKNTFEAEAPLALESLVDGSIREDYAIDMVFKDDMIDIDISSIIPAVVEDMKDGANPSTISTKFHNTFINSIVRAVARISMLTGIRDVCLSGGVFQNRYILKNVLLKLKEADFNVYTNRALPANDASVALGQAYLLRERIKAE